jgi:hypothetical protein
MGAAGHDMTDDVKGDKLKLVADNDEKALVRRREEATVERATVQLKYATSALAANILRIIAGAGKEYELIAQICELLKAYNELQPLSGRASYPYAPSTPIVEGLRELDWRKGVEGYYQPTEEDLVRRQRDGSVAVENAKADVVQAALRLTAAQLMAQPTQESTADSQLIYAMRKFGEAWDVHNTRLHEALRRGRPTFNSFADRTGSKKAVTLQAKDDVERDLATDARFLTKKIGIYDALDEQNRKQREPTKPTSKQP